MKLYGIATLSILTLIILSNGVSGNIYAQTPSCGSDEVIVNGQCVNAFDGDDNVDNDLGLTTDLDLYSQGSTIKISGKIQNYENLVGGAVTMMVISPSETIIQIAQLIPNSDGSFSTQMLADGPQWKLSGDYKISANYGANLKSNILIEFTGGSGNVVSGGTGTVPPPPPPTCTSNQQLINGKCVDNIPPPPPPPPTCTSNQQLIDGQCVDNEPPPPTCGAGTELVNGICKVKQEPQCPTGYSMKDGLCVEEKGGCLIATAAYGTELAPQVQFLREVRDNTVLSTVSGTAFMSGFNTVYYSFAPTVADWERENPIFQEAVRVFITPMLSTLSIMSLADNGSEVEVLGLGISVIVLNLGMYIAAPALIGFKVHKHIKSRK
ncbi:MAG: CFI-box-CTERM domain-containing protein [Candidatus Nitrosopumilus sp. bin_68KS]